jgi:hypothetical protein
MRVQGLGTNEFKQSCWSKALNWSQRLSDEVPRPKSGKLRAKPTWHLFWRRNQLVWNKNSAKRRDPDLENQESS